MGNPKMKASSAMALVSATLGAATPLATSFFSVWAIDVPPPMIRAAASARAHHGCGWFNKPSPQRSGSFGVTILATDAAGRVNEQFCILQVPLIVQTLPAFLAGFLVWFANNPGVI